jgi:hypothetical protein
MTSHRSPTLHTPGGTIMERKICPVKTAFQDKDVFCTSDCAFYNEASNNTKCNLAKKILELNERIKDITADLVECVKK